MRKGRKRNQSAKKENDYGLQMVVGNKYSTLYEGVYYECFLRSVRGSTATIEFLDGIQDDCPVNLLEAPFSPSVTKRFEMFGKLADLTLSLKIKSFTLKEKTSGS